MQREEIDAAFGITQKKEMTWTTYDGITKKISELDHQHLSNILYFLKYVNPNYSPYVIRAMQLELFKRFDDWQLPYRPVWDWEVEQLKKNGLMFRVGSTNRYDIITNREKIGEYEYKN